MIVILKRFNCDDVPAKVLSDTTMNDAIAFAEGVASMATGKKRFASKREQKIAKCDIGSELISFLLVEFDADGEPVRSEIVAVEEPHSKRRVKSKR